jgi:hypothetical protein
MKSLFLVLCVLLVAQVSNAKSRELQKGQSGIICETVRLPLSGSYANPLNQQLKGQSVRVSSDYEIDEDIYCTAPYSVSAPAIQLKDYDHLIICVTVTKE